MEMLYALRSDDPGQARLRELLRGPLVDDVLHAEALGLLRTSPAVDDAQATLTS